MNIQTYSVADSDTHDLLGEGLTRDEVNNVRLQHDGEVQVFREAPPAVEIEEDDEEGVFCDVCGVHWAAYDPCPFH